MKKTLLSSLLVGIVLAGAGAFVVLNDRPTSDRPDQPHPDTIREQGGL